MVQRIIPRIEGKDVDKIQEEVSRIRAASNGLPPHVAIPIDTLQSLLDKIEEGKTTRASRIVYTKIEESNDLEAAEADALYLYKELPNDARVTVPVYQWYSLLKKAVAESRQTSERIKTIEEELKSVTEQAHAAYDLFKVSSTTKGLMKKLSALSQYALTLQAELDRVQSTQKKGAH